ncbi:MAG: hypothetical protein ACJAVN_002488 [Roseivirga sp.]|jgi:uncharacterized protein YbaR (Trm112 family)
MLRDADHFPYLVCPFTRRKLRFLSENELENINNRIDSGELYFHPGIKVQTHLVQALVTEHQSYIYPIIDNILYLKSETAIVAKNRTENYLKRISQTIIEDFEAKYGFNSEQLERKSDVPSSTKSINPELVVSLKSKLHKEGNHFTSIGSSDIDALHNFIFQTNFKQYIHVDFDLNKLKLIQTELKGETILVLADNGNLPFGNGSLDALVSFDPINQYDKADQKFIYDDLKRILSHDATSVVFYENNKPLHTKVLLSADKLSKTARGLVMPWKKFKLPTFYFEGINPSSTNDSSNQTVGKTSLNQQFS